MFSRLTHVAACIRTTFSLRAEAILNCMCSFVNGWTFDLFSLWAITGHTFRNILCASVGVDIVSVIVSLFSPVESPGYVVTNVLKNCQTLRDCTILHYREEYRNAPDSPDRDSTTYCLFVCGRKWFVSVCPQWPMMLTKFTKCRHRVPPFLVPLKRRVRILILVACSCVRFLWVFRLLCCPFLVFFPGVTAREGNIASFLLTLTIL